MAQILYIIEDLFRISLVYIILITILASFWYLSYTKVFPRIPIFREIILGLSPKEQQQQQHQSLPSSSTTTTTTTSQSLQSKLQS